MGGSSRRKYIQEAEETSIAWKYYQYPVCTKAVRGSYRIQDPILRVILPVLDMLDNSAIPSGGKQTTYGPHFRGTSDGGININLILYRFILKFSNKCTNTATS